VPIPTKPLPAIDLSATPTGWVPVAFGDAQVSVPAFFSVYHTGSDPCDQYLPNSSLFIGQPTLISGSCDVARAKPHITVVLVVSVQRVPSPYDKEKSVIINGIRAFDAFVRGSLGYYLPSLGVEFAASGPLARRILATLTRSPRDVSLAHGPAPSVPLFWHRVLFAGVSVAEPPSWRIRVTNSYGPICGPYEAVEFLGTPSVVLDTDKELVVPICPPVTFTLSQPASEGLRIDEVTPYLPSPHDYGACLYVSRLTVCPATSPAYSILVLKVTVPGHSKPMYVSIGLAGNGMVARTILYSLRAASPTEVLGSLSGTFVAIGGLPGPPRPLPGKVTAKDSAGHKFTVAVGKSGKFVMSLRAGVYRLTGRSPMVTVNGVEPTCGIFAPPVHVRAEKETRGVQVVCPLK
jgi:hypothetical protein